MKRSLGHMHFSLRQEFSSINRDDKIVHEHLYDRKRNYRRIGDGISYDRNRKRLLGSLRMFFFCFHRYSYFIRNIEVNTGYIFD